MTTTPLPRPTGSGSDPGPRSSRGLVPTVLFAVAAVLASPLLVDAGLDPFAAAMAGPLAALAVTTTGLLLATRLRGRAGRRDAMRRTDDHEEVRSHEPTHDRTARRRTVGPRR